MNGKGVLLQCVLLLGSTVWAQEQWPNRRQLQCQDECGRYFSPHTVQFEEINPSFNACAHGCEFFSGINAQTHDQPINTLQHCNDSCDERYAEEKINACKAGCGFSFDTFDSPQVDVDPMHRQPSKPLIMTISLPRIMDQFSKMMPGLNNFLGSRLDAEPSQSVFNNELDTMMESMIQGADSPMFERMEIDRINNNEFDVMRDDLTAPGHRHQGMFGRKDDEDISPVMTNLFSSVNDHMQRMMNFLPKMSMPGDMSSMEFGSPFSTGGGEISIFRSGPGFHEEKHYKIDENGVVSEVTDEPKETERLIASDALEHRNPLDIGFSGNDVELFDPEAMSNAVERIEKEEKPVVEEAKDEAKPEEKTEEVADAHPYLAVMKSNLEEQENLRQRFANIFKSYHYSKEASCNDMHLKWSDWVACVHDRLGVPRWFTAATIALGIIFTVWLCLVIPSTAPKRTLRTLIIRGAKPSAAAGQSKELTAAEAKELEANGNSKEPVIAVIKVDLPPSYADVTPGSPAPSYKSNMAPPGSPAPSYKSVEGKGEEQKKDLEPVHAKGGDCVA